MKLLNTLQHTLTPEQASELAALGYTEVVHLREANPELFASMANTPGEETGVVTAACNFLNEVQGGYAGVLLPLGSPALMFCFAQMTGKLSREYLPIFLFAHTERVAEDQGQEDGTVKKVAVFKHVRFLKL